MIVSIAVLIVVSFLVSFGVLWWTGIVLISAVAGLLCGLAAAFAVDALHIAAGRAGARLSDESDQSSSGLIAEESRPIKQQDVDPKG